MREVLTLVYCDNKRRHGDARVDAEVETTVGSEGREYDLDLCGTCNDALMADLAGWAEQGTLRTRTGRKVSPSRNPSAPPPPCPVIVDRDGEQQPCGLQRTSRHSLGAHIRDVHNRSIKDYNI